MLPNGEPLGLDRLLPPLLPTPEHGLVAVPSPGRPLHAPIGINAAGPGVCWADLSGHTLVLGSSAAARSETLAVLVAGLALVHAADAVQFSCVATGPGLEDLAELPHLGALIQPDDRAAVIGLLQHLSAREDRTTAVYLVLDSPALRQRLGPELIAIADAAPGREVHLLIAAETEEQVPDGLRSWFSTRVHLESDRSGRISGLRNTPQSFTSVAARIGSAPIGDDSRAARRRLAEEVAQHWAPRPGAPGFYPAKPARAQSELGVRLGTDERNIPLHHDFARHRSLVVRGTEGGGKTTLLKAIAAELVRDRTPAEVRILLVDYRAGLIDAVPEGFLLGHAFHANALRDLIDGTLWALAGRRTAGDDAPWRGPRLYVLLDDHVDAPDDEDIWAPVLNHLDAAQDAGVHLVLAEATRQAADRFTEDGVSPITLTQALLDIGAAEVELEPRGTAPGWATYRAGELATRFRPTALS